MQRRLDVSIATYTSVVCVPIVVILLWGCLRAMMNLHANEPAAPLEVVPPSPRLQHDKPLVAVLVSNVGTEVTDLVAPYAIFAESGVLEVVTVAPERRVSPLYPGLEVLPDFSFEGLDARPEVIVVPNIADYDNPRIAAWLRRHADAGALMVSVCEGSRAAAAAGLLDGRVATSHFMALGQLGRKYSRVRWVGGVRYQWAGAVVTSAGVTAAIDVSFSVLGRLAGPSIARDTARRLGYEVGPRQAQSPALSVGDYAALATFVAFSPRSLNVTVGLDEDVDELEVAAVADVFQRAMLGRTSSVGRERRVFLSKRGLSLVPQHDARTAPLSDLTYDFSSAIALVRDRSGARAFDPATPGQSYDRALADLAEVTTPKLASLVATTIEYPERRRGIVAAGWPAELWLRPVALGLCSLSLAILFRFLALPAGAATALGLSAAWAAALARIWSPLWRRRH